jgi:hypothetical protein
MKDELSTRPKHLQEHAAKTVIHHPEADDTVLARWLRRGMEKGPKFWVLLGGVTLAFVVIGMVVQGLLAGGEVVDAAWEQVMLAEKPDDFLKAAETPGPARSWAYLQAAEARYQEALQNLPANRDAALPLLTRAYDLFEKAYETAPEAKGKDQDAPERRLAKMGMARTRESRGELDEAITLYKEIARDWPDSDEGIQAKRLVAELQKPENQKFYKDFAAFKPESFTLPPRGRSLLDLPATHPPLNGPMIPAPGLPGLTDEPPSRPSSGTELPSNLFEGAPAPKSSTPPPAPSPPAKEGSPKG